MLIMQLDDLEDADLTKLGQLMRKLFDVFPLMYPKQRKKQSLAVSYLFIALYSKGSCLRNLIAEMAKQCLVLTCSSDADYAASFRRAASEAGSYQKQKTRKKKRKTKEENKNKTT
jgi:hypothetical protein